MSEPVKSPFDQIVDAFRKVVAEEIERALSKQQPPKLLYTTKEAAARLNVPEGWLAAKARSGKVPSRILGHYRMFSPADLEAIIKNGKKD